MRDIKKQLLGAIGILAVLGSSMFAVSPAFAQAVVSEPVVAANATAGTVDRKIGDIMLEGAIVSVVSGINYMAQQIAYSLAVSLTSECPGQKVCWDSKAIGDALTQSWQGAIGESIGTLSDELGLGKYGLDLCNPDPRFLLQLQLGLLDELKPPEPKCDFNAILDSYESLGQEIGSGEFLDRFKVTLTPGQAPVSVSLNILNGLYAEKQEEEKLATIKRINDAAAGGGFSDLRDPVSGRVTAPAEATRQQYRDSNEAKKDGTKNSNQVIAGQIASRAFATIGINFAQTLAQTLVARLWNRFAEGLLSTQELVASQPDLVLNAEGLLNPGRAGISRAIAPRFTNNAAVPRETGVIDMLLILSTCPSEGRQPMNCAMQAELAQAARLADVEPVTVREAIEQDVLRGDWPLISAKDTAHNQDPFCYTYGYCDSNLKKLRAARIISVGWELAASLSTVERPYKLKDVVDGFDDCRKQCYGGANANALCQQNSDCSSDDCRSINERDAEHPFCHLIDPDWVLKAPPTQCRAEVNGPVPLSSDGASRASICVDPRTCLAQDDAGNCIGGYGHCTEDKRVWRFNGQQCPAQFASCQQFTGADGNPVGMLANTIDQGVCNAANAGCQQYSLNRTVTIQGVGGNPASKTDDWAQTYAYLNGTLRTCDSTNDGCQALIPLANSSLNLIRNGGFEELEAVDGDNTLFHPEFWAPYSQAASGAQGYVSRDGSKASSGSNAVLLSGNTASLMQDDITAPGGNTYTLSATLIPATGKDAAAMFVLYFKDKNTSWVDLGASDFAVTTGTTGFTGTPSFSIVTTSSTASDGVSNGLRITFSGTVSGTSGRVWVTFATTKKNVQTMRFMARQSGTTSNPTYLDEVQLEAGGSPTVFHEGYAVQGRTVHAKVAPEYLGCTGSAADRIECNKYAPLCSANEVGCDAYTPTNGDALVPGVVTAQDRCPAECSGYDTFKQEASTFEAEKFPEYFIPGTAKACSAVDVGCSEFTDIENEQVSHYSTLRSCVAANDLTVGTYYSWEGSDTTGYQLKLWNLKNSTDVAAMNGVNDVCADVANCTSTIAPCTKLNGQTGACSSAIATETSNREGFCSRSVIDAGNFDCREFYDTSGNRHYRLLSRTIIASASCRQYRITTSNADDCAESNGRWENDAARCTYFADLGQSGSCSASANGCRAYKGNASTNVRTIFTEDFESGLDGWRDRADDLNKLTVSSESVTVGGHSLKFEVGGEDARALYALDGGIQVGRSYSVSLWARGSGTMEVFLREGDGGANYGIFSDDDVATEKIPSLALSSDWRKYDLGPVFVTQVPASGNVDLFFNPRGVCLGGTTAGNMCTNSTQCAGGGSCTGPSEVFVDNIILKEVQDSITVVRGSWKTPVSCDQTAAGTASPQEMLGCREYKTRLGGTEFLRSFSRICREKAIGCAAYSTTAYTTADPYASTKLAVCYDSAGSSCDYEMPDGGTLNDVCTVPAGQSSCRFSLPGRLDDTTGSFPDRVRLAGDSVAYLAVRAQDRCPSTQESCRVMGTPVLSYPVEGPSTITEWKEGAYIYDAAKFDTLLCRSEEVGCKAYKSDGGGSAYFMDPTGKMCDYRENVGPVTVGTTTNEADTAKYSGWFATGLEGNVVCPGARLSNGSVYAIARNQDASRYAGWTGSCEAQYNKCEEFLDPVDVSGIGSSATPGGRAYYYINDQRVSGATCNSQASLEQGCVLFNRTHDPRKLYNASSTYSASKSRNGALVPPSTSGTLNTNVILKVRPDRECAEWLACNSRQATWDANQGKWRNVCTGLTLCNQSKVSGSGEECTNSIDPDARLLTADVYAKGPREFATNEPTGFSIPNRYPITLTQSAEYRVGACEAVTPCRTPSTEICIPFGGCTEILGVPIACPGEGDACTNNADCGSGMTCSDKKKGMCVDTSSGVPTGEKPCDNSGECGSGQYCSIGPRATTRYGAVLDAAEKCTSDSSCSETCEGGTNAGMLCSSNSQCLGRKENGSAATCSGGNGSCVSGKCFYSLNGGSLSDDFDPTTSPSCRAYPEGDSPFPGSVVTDWNEKNGAAEGVKQSYRGANTCTQGNDCECSYQRYSYVGGVTKFFSPDEPKTRFGEPEKDFTAGICSGGPRQGQPCSPSAEDDCDREKNGICQPIEKMSTAVGWWGFCADPDTGFNINGTLREFACNLWLPIDQLAGAPDLYNQYRDAGFVDSNNLLYCQVGKGTQRANTYSYKIHDEIGTTDHGNIFYGRGGEGNTEVRVLSLDELNAFVGGSSILKEDIAGIRIAGKSGDDTFSFQMTPTKSDHGWEFQAEWDDAGSPDGELLSTVPIQVADNALEGSGRYNRCESDFFKDEGNYGHSDCNTSAGSGGEGNCLLIKPIFVSDTLTGFRAATCLTDLADTGPVIETDITIQLREMCKEIVLTHSPGVTDGAAPWTDRLWKSSHTVVGSLDKEHISGRLQEGDLDMTPYGRIESPLVSPPSTTGGDLKFRTTPGLKIPTIMETGLPIFTSEGGSGYTWVGLNADADGYHNDFGNSASGIPYACEGDCGYGGSLGIPDSWNKRGSSASDVGRDNLSTLFARAWRVYEWDSATETYEGRGGWDMRNLLAVADSFPRVLGVATGSCFAEHGERACGETSNGITVNGRSAGDVFSSGERHTVEIRFYAYADANHMPIRNVRIDYGDGGGEGGGRGYYRNHRGLTVNAGGDKGTPICKSEGAANWGVKAPEACQTGDFSFQKLYLCSNPGSLDECAGGNYPCTRDGACVFRPKVQITDNWGVCNGICPGGKGQGNLCIDDECTSKAGAWTFYDGEIILKPNPR